MQEIKSKQLQYYCNCQLVEKVCLLADFFM
jgi:hypothetical protein